MEHFVYIIYSQKIDRFYVGDTRLQSLISLYVSGDDRLMQKALQLLDYSRIREGLTMGRAPTVGPQVTPPFRCIGLIWFTTILCTATIPRL